MLSMIVAIAIVLVFAVLLAACLRLGSRSVAILAVFLLGYADIVLSIELASMFHQITPLFVLSVHFVLAGLAGVAWWKLGAPDLLGPFRGKLEFWHELPSMRRMPLVYIFSITVGIVYLIGAVLIVTTPQNNYDSMTYHLSRVGYWLRHQSLYPWETPNLRQTGFPMNAEIGVLWTVLFWGTDQLAGFVQWFGAWFAAAAIYGLANQMGARRWQAVVVALLFLSFPEVLLQSITTMNDLITAAFIASAVYLLCMGWRKEVIGYLWLSALAFALAFGSKSTVFLMAPSLVLIVILLMWMSPTNWRKKLFTFFLASFLTFIFFSAFSYLQNFLYHGNPLPLPQAVSLVASYPGAKGQMILEGLTLHTLRAMDLTALPAFIQQPFTELKLILFQPLLTVTPGTQAALSSEWRNALAQVLYSTYPVHEDLAWFGPLILLLFIPAAIGQFISGVRNREPVRLGLIILVFGFSIAFSLWFPYTPYQGRYFTIVMPFVSALVYPWFSNQRNWSWVGWIIVVISMILAFRTILLNQSKPLIGEGAIWGESAQNIRMINNPGFEPIIAALETYVPEESTLATRLGVNAWDYPLFGRQFNRSIVPLDPSINTIDIQQLREQGVDYLLVAPEGRTFLDVPDGLDLLWQRDGWFLFGLCSMSPCEPNPEDTRSIQGLSDSGNLVTLSPDLIGKVGVLGIETVGWGVEQFDGKGIYWLGEGPVQNLKLFLYSDAERPVNITLDVAAGPGRSDPDRSIRFILLPRSGNEYLLEYRVRQERSFSGEALLEFNIELQPGINEIRLFSTDTAQLRVQPNGDQRPLLILIKDIRIEE